MEPPGNEIRMLGEFSVRINDVLIDARHWNRRAAAGLVKLLALAPSRRLHREQVMDALWPDSSLAVARPRLHKAMHFARRALGADAIGADGECLVLLPGSRVVVDVAMFEALAGRALDTGAGVDGVDEALDWHRGELLPQDLYESWTVERRAALRHLRLQLLRRAGRWSELLKDEPADESAHVAVMRAHLGRGEWAAAIAEDDELATVLVRDVGVKPGPDAAAARAAAEEPSIAAGATCRTGGADAGCEVLPCPQGADPGVRRVGRWAAAGEGGELGSPISSTTGRARSGDIGSAGCQAPDFHPLRYDERGCGLSDWDTDHFSVETWASDLLTVVDAAGYERFPLLGEHLDRALPSAAEFAAAHPDRVSALNPSTAATLPDHSAPRPTTPSDASPPSCPSSPNSDGAATNPRSDRCSGAPRFMPDGTKEQWNEFNDLQRRTASPHNAGRFLRAFAEIDATRGRAPGALSHPRRPCPRRPPVQC